MCGICGSTRDPRGTAVARMCQEMVHRGPDDQGIHVDQAGSIAIGARRLSIIDVEGGHQPVANENRTVWAALNGEIYNHPNLQQMLRDRGHRLASRTDTETLVHLYEEYGDAMVHALEGMYSFVVWDSVRQRLLVARDRFGEKPLFFHNSAGILTFASELTALAAGCPDRLRLDLPTIDDFFVLGYAPGEASFADGVRQLPPAHTLTWSVDDPSPRVRRYWAPPARSGFDDRSVEMLVEELEPLVRRAVQTRLISDVPVGVFLSGGLDSTLVTTLAAERSGALKSFTVSYEVGGVNEDAAARDSARRIGTDHVEVVLDQEDVAHRAPAVLGSIDQPNADPALIALHAVAEVARRHVTVAVGGEGADELFAGYPRYRWLQRTARAKRFIPARAGALAAAEIRGRSPSAAGRRVAELLERTDLAEKHIDWVTERRRHQRSELYGPRLVTARSDRVIDDARAITGQRPAADTAARFMDLDRLRWLPDDVLGKADRASMMNSLEVRTPFLDRDLAEFAATVPTARHVQSGGKTLLRGVLARLSPGHEPPPKTAFRVPLAEWLRGPLAELLAHHITDGRLVADGLFDRSALQACALRHNSGVDQSSVLWPALALGVWLEGNGRAFSTG